MGCITLEMELLVLNCALFLSTHSADSANTPHLLVHDGLHHHTIFHVLMNNTTNIMKTEKKNHLITLKYDMSNPLKSEVKFSSTPGIDVDINPMRVKQVPASEANPNSANGEDFTRINGTLIGYFGFHSFFEENGSKVDELNARSVNESKFRGIFRTEEYYQILPNLLNNNSTRDVPIKFAVDVQFNSKHRRSVDDEYKNDGLNITTGIGNDSSNHSEAKPTTTVEPKDTENLKGRMRSSKYGVSGHDRGIGGGEYYDEGEYYGDDYAEDYGEDNDTSGGSEFAKNTSDDLEIDEEEGISGDDNSIVEVDNSVDIYDDENDFDNSGSTNYGDEGDEGTVEGYVEGSGDYPCLDTECYYDINDYDYDKDEVDDGGNDDKSVIDTSGDDIANDLDGIENVFPPHFIKLLLDKYYRTQQMMMSINIFETKGTDESDA